MRDWTDLELADITSRFHPWVSAHENFQFHQLAQRLTVPFVFSHTSAAIIYGLPLPISLRNSPRIHITVSRIDMRPSRKGVTTHTGEIQPEEYVEIGELPVTSPGRTIADLAPLLTIPELNSAFEALRWPIPTDGSTPEFARQEALELALRRLHFPGRGNVLKLAEIRSRVGDLRCQYAWQSLVWMQISMKFNQRAVLRIMRDDEYLMFPQTRVVIPHPFSFTDDRVTVMDRTAEYAYLRSRGYRPAFYSWLDLTNAQFIDHKYRLSRSL